MLPRSPLVALAVALAVTAAATVAPAQSPKNQSPTAKAKTKAKASDAAKKTEASKDPAVSPMAKIRRLRMMVGADAGWGGPGGGRGGPGGGRGGPGGGTQGVMDLLTRSEPLQDELKMTDKQKLALRRISDKSAAQMRQVFQGNRRGGGQNPQQDRQTAMAEMQAQMQSLQEQTEAAFGELIKPSQQTRLQQVVLQIKGPLAVAEPEIAEAIYMEPQQLAQVQQIVGELRNAQQELQRAARGGGPGGPGGNGGPGGAGAAPVAAQTKTAAQTKNGTPATTATKKAVSQDDDVEAPPAAAPPAATKGAQGKGQRRQPQTPEEIAARTAQREKADEESEKMREKAIQEVKKLLSASQKSTFNKLLGKIIPDLSILLPDDVMIGFGGPGGFGGGGGFGGPGGPGGGPGGPGGPGGGGGGRGAATPPAPADN